MLRQQRLDRFKGTRKIANVPRVERDDPKHRGIVADCGRGILEGLVEGVVTTRGGEVLQVQHRRWAAAREVDMPFK